MNEINHPEGFGSGYDVVDKGSDLVGGAHKDAHYLALLLNLKLTYAVVDFDHFGRFDKHRLARGALVVDNTRELALVHWSDGNHQAAVAHGRGGIGIDYAVGGCPRHYSPHHGIDGTRHALEPVANVGKERACVIAYLSIAVENTVEHGGYGRKGGEALRYQIKAGIGRLA